MTWQEIGLPDFPTKVSCLIEMEEGYSAEGEVGRKSMLKILSNNAIYILGLAVLIIGLFGFWRKRRKIFS